MKRVISRFHCASISGALADDSTIARNTGPCALQRDTAPRIAVLSASSGGSLSARCSQVCVTA